MELDRRYIARRDFPAARRGYDPDEVDRHLRELADAVEELRRQADRPAETSVSGAAAEQVRVIVEAAERSAAEIEQHAQDDAQRARAEAEAAARAAREQADAEAAEHIRRVEEATRSMLQRAGSAESQVGQLIDNLRATADTLMENLRSSADGMVSDLRSGAEQVGRELEEIRRGLAEARDARPVPGARDTASAAPRAEPEPEPAPEAELEPQPEPEPQPAYRAPEPDPEPESLKVQGDELQPGGVQSAEAGAPETAEDLPPAPVREPFVPEPERADGPPDAEPEVVRETREVVADAPAAPAAGGGAGSGSSEGARLIALNMALNGTPRAETAAYLSQNFDISDQDALLDEVYSRAGG